MDVGDQIEKAFPDYRSSKNKEKWNEYKADIKLGSELSGVIVLKFDFGFMIDIGLPFPAIMLLCRFKSEVSTFKVGDLINGSVYVFDNVKNQIGITQNGHEYWMEGNW